MRILLLSVLPAVKSVLEEVKQRFLHHVRHLHRNKKHQFEFLVLLVSFEGGIFYWPALRNVIFCYRCPFKPENFVYVRFLLNGS